MDIPAFVEELASNSPAPGGGSVAALGGALAAGLASMVAELTLGRKKYADVQGEMEDLAAKGKKLARDLLVAIDTDTESFNSFMEAMKLPKETDAEKAARREAMQEAAKLTAEVPLKTLEMCCEAEELAFKAVSMGNTNAVTDGGSAGMFAFAAGTAAAYNVRINLMGIKDEAYVADMSAKVKELLTRLTEGRDKLSAHMEKALS